MHERIVPSGTVTFLFTDIEGSTKLWELHPELMRAALARHDALMRETISASSGYIFKTIGDAFCAAFAEPKSALEAAVATQLALNSETWPELVQIKVRMALHTGAVETRDDDYFGPPVNRVARLLGTASGGQSILSQTTYDLVRDSLPAEVSFLDLGSHQLKDLARPEQVFQICHSSLPSSFPALRSLSKHPNNLPKQVTNFIGREKEAACLMGLIEKGRMVTLTGSGGTGKSRLSIHVAANMIERFPDGVWFVELASLDEPRFVSLTVCDAIGLKEQVGKSALQALIGHLQEKKLLLILDNCEHLVDECARLASELLQACSELTLLATSRERLGITGEQTYRVPSLSLPESKADQNASNLEKCEAVRLFIDRAKLHDTEFEVSNSNATALASICNRLDGIPMAIELAAARVRSLTLDDINDKLDQRFRLLTGGSRSALPRQQTLRSLIDWSYDLLDSVEQDLLCRLAMFSGGWTLVSAEEVCSGNGIESYEMLDLLTSLYDKSLIILEISDGRTRYGMLETVRQYAQDRLAISPLAAEMKANHLQYFIKFAENANKKMLGPDRKLQLEALETEHDNLRAALSWSGENEHDFDKGLLLVSLLWKFWFARGHIFEGRDWLQKKLDKPSVDLPVRAEALFGAATLAEIQSEPELALELNMECLEIWKKLGDRWHVAIATNNIGNVYATEGKFDVAEVKWKECLKTWRDLERNCQLGDQQGLAATLDNLGNIANVRGDSEAAVELYSECLKLRRDSGNISSVGYSLVNLCSLAENFDDEATKLVYAQEVIEIFDELGDPIGVCYGLLGMTKKSDPLRSAKIWGAVSRLQEEIGLQWPQQDREHFEMVMAAARIACGDDAHFDAAYDEGGSLTMRQAIEYVLSSN